MATFNAISSNEPTSGTSAVKVDMKFEIVVIPVSDVSDLASALRRAAAAHGQHEKRTGQHDANWPDWYAEYMVPAQNGKELPQ
jgi:hypothetical protein